MLPTDWIVGALLLVSLGSCSLTVVNLSRKQLALHRAAHQLVLIVIMVRGLCITSPMMELWLTGRSPTTGRLVDMGIVQLTSAMFVGHMVLLHRSSYNREQRAAWAISTVVGLLCAVVLLTVDSTDQIFRATMLGSFLTIVLGSAAFIDLWKRRAVCRYQIDVHIRIWLAAGFLFLLAHGLTFVQAMFHRTGTIMTWTVLAMVELAMAVSSSVPRATCLEEEIWFRGLLDFPWPVTRDEVSEGFDARKLAGDANDAHGVASGIVRYSEAAADEVKDVGMDRESVDEQLPTDKLLTILRDTTDDAASDVSFEPYVSAAAPRETKTEQPAPFVTTAISATAKRRPYAQQEIKHEATTRDFSKPHYLAGVLPPFQRRALYDSSMGNDKNAPIRAFLPWSNVMLFTMFADLEVWDTTVTPAELLLFCTAQNSWTVGGWLGQLRDILNEMAVCKPHSSAYGDLLNRLRGVFAEQSAAKLAQLERDVLHATNKTFATCMLAKDVSLTAALTWLRTEWYAAHCMRERDMWTDASHLSTLFSELLQRCTLFGCSVANHGLCRIVAANESLMQQMAQGFVDGVLHAAPTHMSDTKLTEAGRGWGVACVTLDQGLYRIEQAAKLGQLTSHDVATLASHVTSARDTVLRLGYGDTWTVGKLLAALLAYVKGGGTHAISVNFHTAQLVTMVLCAQRAPATVRHMHSALVQLAMDKGDLTRCIAADLVHCVAESFTHGLHERLAAVGAVPMRELWLAHCTCTHGAAARVMLTTLEKATPTQLLALNRAAAKFVGGADQLDIGPLLGRTDAVRLRLVRNECSVTEIDDAAMMDDAKYAATMRDSTEILLWLALGCVLHDHHGLPLYAIVARYFGPDLRNSATRLIQSATQATVQSTAKQVTDEVKHSGGPP